LVVVGSGGVVADGEEGGAAPSLGRNTLVGVAPQRARGDALQPTPRFHFLGAE
jgi:hypothetical protein